MIQLTELIAKEANVLLFNTVSVPTKEMEQVGVLEHGPHAGAVGWKSMTSLAG